MFIHAEYKNAEDPFQSVQNVTSAKKKYIMGNFPHKSITFRHSHKNDIMMMMMMMMMFKWWLLLLLFVSEKKEKKAAL
jgi:hypothetical protein